MNNHFETTCEEKVKEQCERRGEQTAKTLKLVFRLVFGSIGIIFTLTAILLFYFNVTDEITGFNPALVFLPLGLIFISVGFIVSAFIPNKVNYERKMTRINNYGYVNMQDISFALELHEMKIKELEERVLELEKKDTYNRF